MQNKLLVVIFTIISVLITIMLMGVSYKCYTLTVEADADASYRILSQGSTGALSALSSAFITGKGGITGEGGGLTVVPDNGTKRVKLAGDDHEYAVLSNDIAYIDVVIKTTYESTSSMPYIALPDAKLRPDGALLNITIHDYFFDNNGGSDLSFGIRAPVTLTQDNNDNDNYSITSYIPDSDTSNYNNSGLVVNPQIRYGGKSVHQILVKPEKDKRGAIRLLLRSHRLKLDDGEDEVDVYVWSIQHYSRGTMVLGNPSSVGTQSLTLTP